MTKEKLAMTTVLNDTTVLACNPLGVGRVVPGKCVQVALAFIGSGKTVKEYQEHMKKWVDNHPAPHMCFPGGGSPMGLLRYLVDRNKKVVVIDKKPGKKAKTSKPKASKKVKELTARAKAQVEKQDALDEAAPQE
jgi:hypothetical protein